MAFAHSKRPPSKRPTANVPETVDEFTSAKGGGSGPLISDTQYFQLAKLVYKLCGINLGQGKRELLKARLMKRLRATGAKDVNQYMDLLQNDPSGRELISFLDCITTNKTDFFREPQHFDFLADTLLPELSRLCRGSEPLRIWSAACSTGEEPYTLAIVLMQNRTTWSSRGVSILASDLSTQVLSKGQRGVYATDRIGPIPQNLLKQYFQKGVNQWAGHVRVRPELRKLVTFKRINLMDNFQFDPPFHVVFCRNVMIYFDKETREALVNRFHRTLVPGGYLFVGHSESLTGINHPFRFVQPAIYRKEV